jgi:hypothetical protein
MSAPRATSVGTTPVKIVENVRGAGMTKSRKLVIISVNSDQEGDVYLSFGTRDGLTNATGLTLYKGQALNISPDSPSWQSIADMDIWAVTASGTVSVRIQEVF